MSSTSISSSRNSSRLSSPSRGSTMSDSNAATSVSSSLASSVGQLFTPTSQSPSPSNDGNPVHISEASITSFEPRILGPSVPNANTDVDPQILEALRSKERLYVLKLGEQMEGIIQDRKLRLDLTPATTYQRLLIHRCSAYYKLQPENEPASKILSVILTAESRIPNRRICDLVPPEATAQPTFKIMRRALLRKPQSHSGSVAGEEADLSDVEPSEAGSLGGRSSATGGSTKKRMTIEEREAAYNEARTRIFMDFEEKEKDREQNASSSSASVASASTSAAGRSSTGDADESVSSFATESEWSGSSHTRDKKDSRRFGNGSSASRPLRSNAPPFTSSNPRPSTAESPSFTYASLYEPIPQGPAYEPSPSTHPQGFQPAPYMYPYATPIPGHPLPPPPFLPPYPYYSPYPYPPPPLPPPPQPQPQPHSNSASPSNGEVYPPPPIPYANAYPWHPPMSQGQLPPQVPGVQVQPQSPPIHVSQPMQTSPTSISPTANFAPHSGFQPYMQPLYSYPMPGYFTPQPSHPMPMVPITPHTGDHQSLSAHGPVPNATNTVNFPGDGPEQFTRLPISASESRLRLAPKPTNQAPLHGVKIRSAPPPPRPAWSYGPGVSQGGFSGSSGIGGDVVGPRFSNIRRQSNNSTTSNHRSSSNGDEASSTASSSTSSSSRRTFTSSTSSSQQQHPLPARPDWAVGLKPDPTLHAPHPRRESDHAGLVPRNVSPIAPRIANGGPNHAHRSRIQSQQTQTFPSAPTEFPPLSLNDKASAPGNGIWNGSASTHSNVSNGGLSDSEAPLVYAVSGPERPGNFDGNGFGGSDPESSGVKGNKRHILTRKGSSDLAASLQGISIKEPSDNQHV